MCGPRLEHPTVVSLRPLVGTLVASRCHSRVYAVCVRMKLCVNFLIWEEWEWDFLRALILFKGGGP